MRRKKLKIYFHRFLGKENKNLSFFENSLPKNCEIKFFIFFPTKNGDENKLLFFLSPHKIVVKIKNIYIFSLPKKR